MGEREGGSNEFANVMFALSTYVPPIFSKLHPLPTIGEKIFALFLMLALFVCVLFIFSKLHPLPISASEQAYVRMLLVLNSDE